MVSCPRRKTSLLPAFTLYLSLQFLSKDTDKDIVAVITGGDVSGDMSFTAQPQGRDKYIIGSSGSVKEIPTRVVTTETVHLQ